MGNEQYRNITGHKKGGDISISKKMQAVGASAIEIESRNIVEELLAERKNSFEGNPLLLLLVIQKIMNQVSNLLKKGHSAEEIKESGKIQY